MKKLPFFCLALYAISGVMLVYLCLNGWVTFGQGLGDVFALLLHALVYLIVSGMAWLLRKGSGIVNALVLLVMLVHGGVLVLQLTIFRGVEYPWNHQLFYR